MLLKCDNENAIKAVVTDVCELLKKEDGVERVSMEHSPPHDSQGNGGTEIGIKLVRGVFRTLRSCLQHRVGRTLPMHHPLTPWMLEHSAVLLDAVNRGTDGLTAWARVRGRPFGLKLYEFGELVAYKIKSKGPEHDERGNMAMRSEVGVFLGYDRDTNEYIMFGDGQIRRARALTMLAHEEKWRAEALEKVD